MSRAYLMGNATSYVKCDCLSISGHAWSVNGRIYYECSQCKAVWLAYFTFIPRQE